MPLYFSRVKLIDDERKLIERLVPVCSYAGPLIKTIVFKNVKRYNHHVKTILGSVPNLKSLTLTWITDSRGVSVGRFLPRRPVFHLRVLNLTKRPRTQDLVNFVKAHRETLVHLQATLDPEDLNNDFRALRVLGNSVQLLQALDNSGSQIKCLELRHYWLSRAPPMPFIRSICVTAKAYVGINDLSTLFPNVVFMTIINVSLIRSI